MDVRCNRCATEYDFDDALISERGTTVKCTNCGYQFKVFPPDASSLAPERWVVRTASGKEHVFTSLRDLQRGITEQKVGANDLLSRGRQPPRALGSIAELEQFFIQPRLSDRVAKTLHGVAPPGSSNAPPEPATLEPTPVVDIAAPRTQTFGGRSITTPLGTSIPESDLAVTTVRTVSPEELMNAARNSAPALAPSTGTLPGPGPVSATPPRVVPAAAPRSAAAASATLQSIGAEPPPRRPGSQPDFPAVGYPPPSRRPGSQPDFGGGFTPSPARVGAQPDLTSGSFGVSPETRSNPRASSPMLPPQSAGRRDLRSYDEIPNDPVPDHGRRARSRWIAAVVILGVVALFALTIGRRYLSESRQTAAAPTPQSDGKVAAFLSNGNRLMDEGQLEEAGEELTKASALSERDPQVLAALARWSVLRADVYWLRLRLLDPKVVDLVQSTHRELGRRTGKARATVDNAFTVAPENIVVLRARVDAHRLSGDHDTAREWIKPIASQPADPENAYVLAALDLAEEAPSWPAVIDRLKTAVAGERTPGRAHAALIYALTRASRLTEAEAELTKLEASPNSAMLLDELRGFVQRHRATADGGVREKSNVAVDPQKLGKPDPEAKEPAAAGAAQATGGDFRRLLEQGSAALRRGDLDRAESLYEQVLARQPGNTEALAGLGDVARRRNDPAGASRMYERVLENNPNYVPALLASADQKWEAGDRKGAVVLYKRVLDQAGAASEYGQRASVRLAQAARAESEPENAQPAPDATEPKPPAEPAPPEPPPIDTTDLPEMK